MNTTIHKAEQRGSVNHGWLKANHSFSFGHYFDPEKMGFGLLRVINDDIIAPGKGFGTHPHDNMEIVTIPLHGALAHKDSMGFEEVIRHGEVQAMSAGTGILHSEYNYLTDQETNILQIWVMPKERNIEPRYNQKKFVAEERKGRWQTLVSPDGSNGSVSIYQDAWFQRTLIDAGESLAYDRQRNGNGLYLFVISGDISVGGHALNTRDAVGITDTDTIKVQSESGADILLIDVPMA